MAKSDLSRDAIVDRALDLADDGGLESLTIRRLAQELGVTPMALYWHVKNKDELLDAMGDRLFAGLHYAVPTGAEWDVALRAVVRALVDALRAHPTCIELAFRRILVCEDGRRLTEYTLGVLREAGFSRRATADVGTHALQTAVMLVRSEPGAEPGRTPEDVTAMLAQKRAALEQLPQEQYPYLREMADDLLHCDDVQDYYDFGIELFITGARGTLAGLGLGGRAESLS